MFQAQKRKVPQLFGNSFKQFSEDYLNRSKTQKHNFQHLLLNKDDFLELEKLQEAVQQKYIYQEDVEQTGMVDKLKEEKLLTFMQTNFSKQKSTANASSHMGSGQKSFYPTSTLNSTMKQSFFFQNEPRNIERPDITIRKTNYQDQYRDTNTIMHNERTYNTQKAKDFFQSHICFQKKNYDPTLLNFSKQESKLCTPLERRNQLQKCKENQTLMHESQNSFFTANQHFRVIKGEYKSGILQVDNPLNPSSQLYPLEQQGHNKKEILADIRKKNNQMRQRELKKFNGQSDILYRRSLDNNNVGCSLDPIAIGWNSQMPVQTSFVEHRKNTGERLFGMRTENRYSLSRAENIIKNQTKGQNFDIISYKKNDIELQIDTAENLRRS